MNIKTSELTGAALERGMVYVLRRINGVDVPLRIHNQLHYKEYLGCFSAI